MTTQTTTDPDRELKARHRAMWALGDYPVVAQEVVPDLGATLVEYAAVVPGEKVLDLAAGSGNAAIPAALAGADVTASDLTPELMAAGKAQAEERGAQLRWWEADAEALPFAEGEFDVVLSCIGVMFAPHHQRSADELVRVCRPGGRIALACWTPGGFVGEMFAVMKPYSPPPPPGASPAPLWGDPDHVSGLLGDRVGDVTHERRMVTVDAFGSPEEFRDFFKTNYGPTVATYRSLGADPDRVAALDHDLANLAGQAWDGPSGSMQWEYLLLRARKTMSPP